MKCLFVICFVISITGIYANIQNVAKSYFNSDIVRTFAQKWKPYMDMFGNTMGFTVREAFGHNSMNVYINRYVDPLLLSTGYYHSDNQVKLVFQTVFLEALPHLFDLEISFPLHSNAIQVEASVSKMILHTNYVLFRNKSDIIFVPEKQDPLAGSPFRFQQVRNIGALAITVEGCTLAGTIVSTLSGNSVNIGHNDLKIKECQYGIEIYQLNHGAPPVIANYWPNTDTGLNLDDLLMLPLTSELLPKLQAAMFSEVNTSSIFDVDLPKIRSKQAEVIEEAMSMLDDIVRAMNQKTLEKNMGTVELNNFVIVWDEPFTEIPTAKSVTLSKMVLIGLDSVYATHSGGPVRLTDVEILDQFRFGTLQVVGTITVEGFTEANEFAVEISDFSFDATIDVSNKLKLDARGWRYLEFSCPAMEFIAVESLVVGYLLKELPVRLKTHLNSVYSSDVTHLNSPIHGDMSGASFSHEEALDGKAYVNTHELMNSPEDSNEFGHKELSQKLDSSEVKINHVNAKLEEEDNGKVKLNNVEVIPEDDQANEHVKLNDVVAIPEEEDQGDVKIHHVAAVAEVEDQGHVKLHNVVAELEPEDQGPVKLHHVEAHTEVEDQGHVKLHHVEAKAETEDEGHVKLHHVEAKAETEDEGHVKLHAVVAEPEQEDQGPVKIHHVAAELEPEDQGKVKLNYVGMERAGNGKNKGILGSSKARVANLRSIKPHTNGTDKQKVKKIAKAGGKKKILITEKKRDLVKQVNANATKVASNITINNGSALHMSDNEIHSS